MLSAAQAGDLVIAHGNSAGHGAAGLLQIITSNAAATSTTAFAGSNGIVHILLIGSVMAFRNSAATSSVAPRLMGSASNNVFLALCIQNCFVWALRLPFV